jgi:6-pyruvoyltetrahydropterin/6-carboxytetrahydropterin synthase
MVHLTRKEHFNAAHRLYVSEWNEEKNFEIFGKCANKNFHGHNYNLYVTVKGIPDATTGMIINTSTLSELIQQHVCEKLDHKNMNIEVDFLWGIQPTTENVVIAIWEQLLPWIGNLHCVRLEETENIFAEYYGSE